MVIFLFFFFHSVHLDSSRTCVLSIYTLKCLFECTQWASTRQIFPIQKHGLLLWMVDKFFSFRSVKSSTFPYKFFTTYNSIRYISFTYEGFCFWSFYFFHRLWSYSNDLSTYSTNKTVWARRKLLNVIHLLNVMAWVSSAKIKPPK